MSVFKFAARGATLILSVVSTLCLTACDGEWVAKPYYGAPYSHDRTAGHGVEWVRASLLPERAANTETIMKKEEAVAAPVETVPPPPPTATPGDVMFKKQQSK